MSMKTPPHPGRILRDEIVTPLNLGVTDAAKILGVTRPTLSKLLNEKAGLSAEMAIRIEKAFGIKADHLMRMQLAFDMAKVRRSEEKILVSRYRPI